MSFSGSRQNGMHDALTFKLEIRPATVLPSHVIDTWDHKPFEVVQDSCSMQQEMTAVFEESGTAICLGLLELY